MVIPVEDPAGAARDPGMPFLAAALDPRKAERELGERLLCGQSGATLRGIGVLRHKPGRRCLVEYEVVLELPGGGEESLTCLGKVRARGADRKSYEVQRALRGTGFAQETSEFCVPEPLGLAPAFHMWLQRKVPGEPATALFAGPGGESLARRVAGLAHALHESGVTPGRRPHLMADELRILRERLPVVAAERPGLEGRIQRLLAACERLGGRAPEPTPRGIHRDFYGDQVLSSGERLYLLDLDLYCEGDPALDIGNFLAHMTEWSLRVLGDPAGLAHQEAALEERFLELSPEVSRRSVAAYATLTLARHVYISTLFSERRAFTGALLELCEERLDIESRP